LSNKNPPYTGGELRCSGRVSSSCSNSGIRHVTLVTILVISLEWGKERTRLWLRQTMGRRGRDHMVVGFTTTHAYYHWFCEFESRSGMRCTALCDKSCQWLATGRWFALGPPVSSPNKIDRHDIIEILLKVAFNTIKQASKRKTDHIHDHLWHRYFSVTVHQVMLVTLRHSKWLLKLNH
jgi:hypothetical protein